MCSADAGRLGEPLPRRLFAQLRACICIGVCGGDVLRAGVSGRRRTALLTGGSLVCGSGGEAFTPQKIARTTLLRVLILASARSHAPIASPTSTAQRSGARAIWGGTGDDVVGVFDVRRRPLLLGGLWLGGLYWRSWLRQRDAWRYDWLAGREALDNVRPDQGRRGRGGKDVGVNVRVSVGVGVRVRAGCRWWPVAGWTGKRGPDRAPAGAGKGRRLRLCVWVCVGMGVGVRSEGQVLGGEEVAEDGLQDVVHKDEAVGGEDEAVLDAHHRGGRVVLARRPARDKLAHLHSLHASRAAPPPPPRVQ